MGGGEAPKMAVGFEQGTGKDGDSQPCAKSRHSKSGDFYFLNNSCIFKYLNAYVMYVCVRYKKNKLSFCAG
jgi:hypothetical protein